MLVIPHPALRSHPQPPLNDVAQTDKQYFVVSRDDRCRRPVKPTVEARIRELKAVGADQTDSLS